MIQFKGTCEELCKADRSVLDPVIGWISGIPFEEWPQQHRLMGQLRPAMVTDPKWHGFHDATMPLVRSLSTEKPYNLLLSVIMPGHYIPPHKDAHGHEWLYRIHLPLTTNVFAFMVMDKPYHMQVGAAYKINTQAEHWLVNMGQTPRIHFMFDVGASHGGHSHP